MRFGQIQVSGFTHPIKSAPVAVGWVASLLCLCFLFAAVAHGVDWTLTTADFQKQTVTLQALDETGLTVVTQGGVQPVKVPREQFLAIDRTPAVDEQPGAMVLHLSGGGRLVGQPVRLEGDNIIWRTRSVGDVPASLRYAEGITRSHQPLPSAMDPSPQDRVHLANGDTLQGIVADVADASLILQIGADAVPVPLESIEWLHFAETGERAASQAGFQLRLTDGSIVSAPAVRVENNQLEIELAGEVRRLPLSSVTAIEQVNGPVMWLSDQPPVEAKQTPFLGDPLPARFNTTLDGRPVRLGNHRISKAIAVHSQSVLTWNLPQGYQRFRTQYAIDGDLPHANVTVRIRLDGRIVHEQEDITAGPPGPVVEVDLGDARQITLEVDYGRTYDVQDRLIWIEPALLR